MLFETTPPHSWAANTCIKLGRISMRVRTKKKYPKSESSCDKHGKSIRTSEMSAMYWRGFGLRTESWQSCRCKDPLVKSISTIACIQSRSRAPRESVEPSWDRVIGLPFALCWGEPGESLYAPQAVMVCQDLQNHTQCSSDHQALGFVIRFNTTFPWKRKLKLHKACKRPFLFESCKVDHNIPWFHEWMLASCS